ncbi:Williams Beuren syndrome chromosome region 22 protein [Cichlidogyrus casuarinus]|uniref:18S rRNA (guanine-N(7))-methyltransferase n=1 Tax=Cichlidogyrus casuarinus TaxID=1844966 RepID=A0ABD2QIX8_9PLAT
MSERAIELLAMPEDESHIILDIGCGSGLSGDCITEAGHTWIGIDISRHMLDVALYREVEGDLLLGDMGEGLPFRAGSFDGAISVSAIQWLCNAETSNHNPIKRMQAFFSTLYASLTREGRAVLQFYPESVKQADLLQREALRAGFTGGIVVDFPNSTRAKKCFLVLNVNPVRNMPQPLLETSQDPNLILQGRILNTAREARRNKRHPKNSVSWIKEKKERARKQMKDVQTDSKYTGRKRKPRF